MNPITVTEQEKPANKAEWDEVASYIREERDQRKSRRMEYEQIWKEIDRQIQMDPLPREIKSGEKADWYPQLETPLQFNTLEVIAADARRLLFPRNQDWYTVTSDLSPKYMKRFDQRRQTSPMVQGSAIPEQIDQETADTLVKATLEHFHKLYDFRAKVDLFLAEQIKYGTGVMRVREVQAAKFSHDYRGITDISVTGPACIPCSIWSTYLDDRDTMMQHEGMMVSPAVIRDGQWQYLGDLVKAAEAGGKEKGWLMDNIRRLVGKTGKDKRRGQIEKIEYEGDLIIPKKNESGFLFMPNVLVTVAYGTSTEVVRFQTNPYPFRSYVIGRYMRDDVTTPYGASPLMKGQPIAEACSQALNDLMAAGALNAQPPIAYDRHDSVLLGMGGPQVYPRALWPADAPDRVIAQKIGDPGALLNSYMMLTKQYENVTGVNDPRRGAETKSHTTATAIDIESTKGLSRTDDFVIDLQKGPITTLLYMEYEIIKRVLRRSTDIAINMSGIEGWVPISASDLPDDVEFSVSGAVGVLEEKERHQNFLAALQTVVQLQQAAMQTGAPFQIDYQALAIEEMSRAGVLNASKFITPAAPPQPAAPGIPGAPAGGPQLPGLTSGIPPAVSPTVQATQFRQ